MSFAVCKPCAPYKVMETTIVGKISANSNSSMTKNLDWKSYSFIWEYFTERLSSNLPPGNIHTRIHQSNWCSLYDRLSKFANLPFLSKKTSLYQLYLITKPTDQTDPNYHQLKSFSIATLITILWTELKGYLFDSNFSVEIVPTEEIFISAVKNQSLNQIENDVELLIDLSPTQSDWDKILNLYIFYQSETRLEINQSRINHNSPRNNKNHLCRQFVNLTYHWPTFLEDLLRSIHLERTGENSFLEDRSQSIHLERTNKSPFFNKNVMPDIFNVILTGDHLLPTFRIDNYGREFKKSINRRILAEAVLRRFVWRHLRIMFMPDHDLLVRTLKLKQLSNIYQGNNICDIIIIPDSSPAWVTYITNIGNILISRAANELSGCTEEEKLSIHDSETRSDNELIETYQKEDSEKEFLRKWYNRDRNYALVALANSIRVDGSVDICSLNIQIKARIKRGVLSRDN
uniref:Uncharacterized protein n=1 Tax=Pithovirus LCPAC201 TaxID=2506591 RepID=A0A481Z4D4_9VIRU|nr:MAG: hypothetical protein LCPAC201_00590 [Pithovirus LCPAC201]